MKILMITPYIPYPPVSGGQTRSYNLIKKLSSKHEITLFSFVRKDEKVDHSQELGKYCTKVRTFKRAKAWSSLSNILFTGFSPYPYLVSLYYAPQVRIRKFIEKELKDNNYDLIHAETFYVMPNIPKTSVPTLLVEQTIEYLVYQHFTKGFKWWPLKPLLYLDIFKLKFWEKYFWKKANRVVAMSQADKEIMLKLVPELTVDIVPNGVEAAFFGQAKKEKPTQPTILFVGNFNWLQNREAVEFLVEKIWPLILKEIPNVKLWIVGKNPSPSIKKLAADNIIVDETVDDIRDAYRKSDLLLAPIKGGGGTRYKVLEAMSSGLPVVTTSIGIEGLGAHHKKEALIADETEGLAQAAIDLLKDPKISQDIAARAKLFVHQNYDWEKIAQELDEIYREVASVKKS